MTLLVTEIFASLQGEGFWTGVPMTFVRLAGCNGPDLGLGCTEWCDTPGSWDARQGRAMEVGEVLAQVTLPRLCLTGGEPLLQLESVGKLIEAAERRALRVHLETNGSISPGEVLPGDEGLAWAVVSPKPPEYLVAEGWEGLVDELKLVAEPALDTATAERLAEEYPGAIVSIQPCWRSTGTEGDVRPDPGAFERAVSLVMSHPEWRLSLQTHKYLGIR